MIERIHQIWIQGEEHLKNTRPDLHGYCSKWKLLFPNSKYTLWSELDILEVLRTFSEDLVQVYTDAPHYACKSDIARYAILYRYGGLYVDTDYEPFQNFEYLVDNTVSLAVVAMSLIQGKKQLANFEYNKCWIYARKECGYMKQMLESIIQSTYRSKNTYKYVWNVTGPKAFGTHMTKHGLAQKKDVRVFPHTFIEISDFSIGNIRHFSEEEIKKLYPWCIGIHRNDASWIPKSLYDFRTSSEKLYYIINNWSDHCFIGMLLLIVILLVVCVKKGKKVVYLENFRH